MMYGPQAAFIAEQFPTRVRYTSSLAYTLAGIVGGGVAPAMFATLMKLYKTTTVVAAYTVMALLITGAVLPPPAAAARPTDSPGCDKADAPSPFAALRPCAICRAMYVVHVVALRRNRCRSRNGYARPAWTFKLSFGFN